MPYTDQNHETLHDRPEAFRVRPIQLGVAARNVEQFVRIEVDVVAAASLSAQTSQSSPSLIGYHANQESLEQNAALDAARLLAEQARNN